MKMLHITFQKVKGQTELFIKLQRNPSLANEASFHVGDPFYLLFFLVCFLPALLTLRLLIKMSKEKENMC